jgi:hypothetical protein
MVSNSLPTIETKKNEKFKIELMRESSDKNPPKFANMKTLQVQNQNFQTKISIKPTDW